MNMHDLASILNRFDRLNDSVLRSILVNNTSGARSDITLHMVVHDSEDDFSRKYITLTLIDVAALKLTKIENVTSFVLSFGATFVFQDDFYFMELGGSGEQKSIDEIEDEDIYIKFRRCELSEILDASLS